MMLVVDSHKRAALWDGPYVRSYGNAVACDLR